MKTDPRASRLLAVSERVYHALLVLYPADFRRDYGQHMMQVFRDVCRDTYRQRGAAGLVTWWAEALFDLLQTALAERRKVNFTMSQAKFIQWSGWLCILGGMFFVASSVSQLQSGSGIPFQLSLFALAPGMALIMLGLLGILLRYKAHLNLFGIVSLLTALIGAGLTAIGWLLTLTGVNGFWNVFFIGWLVQLAGHTVFGGFATTTHLLPKWNFALLIGSALPLTIVVLGLGSQQANSGANWGAFVMMLLIGIGWMMTGWALNSQPAAPMKPLPGT
jgi:hypothetical protein